jgi:hypothetical protein
MVQLKLRSCSAPHALVVKPFFPNMCLEGVHTLLCSKALKPRHSAFIAAEVFLSSGCGIWRDFHFIAAPAALDGHSLDTGCRIARDGTEPAKAFPQLALSRFKGFSAMLANTLLSLYA